MMNSTRKISILRRFGLLIWAWLTLILCVVLVLLVNQMLGAGRNPVAELQERLDAVPEQAAESQEMAESRGTREIVLFFSSAMGRVLATETAIIEYNPRTVENCRNALLLLIKGPKQKHLMPLMPEQTLLRGMYLQSNGDLIVDLSTETLLAHHRPRSAEMEALMAFGIVNTLMQPELQGEDEIEVKQVRFLFDGSTSQEIFPVHVDLTDPLVQDKRWVQAGYE